MSRRVTFAHGEYYHLYNRGTEKRRVFLTSADYERFLALLYLCNSTKQVRIDNFVQQAQQGSTLLEKVASLDRGETLVAIGAYVLMQNHFHLLVREQREQGIAQFMQKLMTGYTMYFNIRRQRTGALFQGKFKATHADEDTYLKYLTSYIHLNPVTIIEPHWKERGIKNRTKVRKFLMQYPYSSFRDYGGDARVENCIIEKILPHSDFETPQNFIKSTTDWLSFHHTHIQQGSTLLG